jgi:exodeoxyribonuclease V alpha subunit
MISVPSNQKSSIKIQKSKIPNMLTLKGIIQRLSYQNPDNYYTIARLKVARIGDPVTIAGRLAGVVEGESLEISGKWVVHPKYGDQFSVERYTVLLPATVSGIRQYLASGIVRGIGKSIADKIVDHFQEDTFDIIENEPERLKEVHGIGKAKTNALVQAWSKHHTVRRVMQFLQDHGVGIYHAAAILQVYGADTLNILGTDPYRITKDIPGLGFNIADCIAMKSGVSKDDENRLKACLVHGLCLAEQDGHVYQFKGELFTSCSKIAGPKPSDIDPEKFETALKLLSEDGDIRIESSAEEKDEEAPYKEPDKESTKESIRVFLSKLYKAEIGISSRLNAMQSLECTPFETDLKNIRELILTRMAIRLSEEQLKVIHHGLKEKILVITGGPGTGKTTLIRALCEIFKAEKQSLLLGAPTGRAARRLSELTGEKAATLHKILGFDHENQSFARSYANPLEMDIFVVDEASMVDTLLMYHLLEATPVTSRLILVGDTFQLPSVGPGRVLSDIIDSDTIKVFSLTQIFRQAEESPIVHYAHCIRNDEKPDFKNPAPGELSEFYFIEKGSPEKIVETVVDLCSKRIPAAFPHIDEIQVLTPMHRGENGTINMNRRLQSILNPGEGGIESRGILFKTGDKVMHLKNNYEKDVFNGDIGIIEESIKSEGRVLVNYDGRIVEYELPDLDELSLAYAISVHKSQGSEYSAVVIILTPAHRPLLQRNLLYTALTRGKQLVIIVGSSKALEIALENRRTTLRRTSLKEKLRN